ncbi:uncharacterized protein LOC124170300 [Ischnura elegans]|uniref:uncharacterized protein LOC124170300 n=1 Tax=Ischnura elegans TaxID=197161 RepID=UPI001ED88C40|nr:uncharacterized protein LOC124170300 [Ischnura elegans]
MALYIEFPQERLRLARGLQLSEEVTSEVLAYLTEVNRLIRDLRNLQNHVSDSAQLVFQRTSRRVDGPVLGDAPAVNEIAGIIRTSVDYNPRQVVIWKKGAARPHQVNYLSETYEALQYPLIFPHATSGWHPELRDREGRKYTQVKYYRRLLLSNPRFTFLRRLAQEYFVDMWCRAEEERLQFIKRNQHNALKIASRRELDETIVAEGGTVPGKIYLPSSYTNSPRYLQLRYMDGMAIVTRKGNPSFFLTVTCNPSWQEIKSGLNPGEKHSDRPDLCVRVFHEKLRKLLIAIRSGILFGELIYILYVIEFQKRGLPHAHIAFRVAGGGPTQSVDIDSFVRATIPSREEANGRLRELVLQHMIHGPCGIEHPNAPCMDKDTGKCSKRFPRAENDVTNADRRGFILYRRPCEESVRIRRNRVITDKWIVPYNPAVLLMLECHCNLEVSTSQRVIKYLFKYIIKGSDRARVAIVEEQRRDEVENYANLRYISACEALWRILEYDISCRESTVINLPIHLEHEDNVIFQLGQEIEALQRSKSNLWLYFNRPNTPELTPLTYLEFYEQFIVETTENRGNEPFADGRHFLKKRQRGNCVARLRWLSPTLGELFFLRMLLVKFPGRSYEDLRTVDGVIHATFQEAAMARGLLDEQSEFDHALQEASAFKTGRGLRQLFFAVIMFGAPAAILWDKFKDCLSEDYMGNEDNARIAHHRALCDIDHMLRPHGRCLRDLGLPEVEDVSTELGREVTRWNSEDAARSAEEWRHKLTEEQLSVSDAIINAVTGEDANKVFFIDGPSGTGKTVVLNYITARLRSEGAVVLCTASTGIAALNHLGGITAHSMFQLPLETDDPHATCGITGGSQRAELIRRASLIIWDEAPMAHKVTVEILDRSLRDICQNRQAFGGKVMVLAGDFRQIPPIIPDGSKGDIIEASRLLHFGPASSRNGFERFSAQERTRTIQNSYWQLARTRSHRFPSQFIVPYR